VSGGQIHIISVLDNPAGLEKLNVDLFAGSLLW
jgi:hypothetical protein